MPFYELNHEGFEAWQPSMPRPLVVAVLDGAEEKEGRTTVVLSEGDRTSGL